MIINNLNDKFLDQLNSSLQTDEDINAGIFKINPIGNNNLGSFQLYYQRKNYQKAINNKLQTANVDIYANKDFIYKHSLYGKINTEGYPVSLNDNNVKKLTSNNKISALNLVADAYDELFAKHKSIVERNLISTKSKFYNITPKLGYTSPNLEHSKYLNIYFNDFLKYIENNRIKHKILDLNTLISQFINYYNSSGERTLFNRSEYIISNLCSPLSSGLVIQFATDDQGDDRNKYEKYINDPSFIAFDNLIKEYGFVIDRNAPWRLIFDLQSPRAEKYLQKYNINNLEQFFEQNYYLTEYFDYENMKINLVNLYNFFANKEPSFKNIKTVSINDKICISEETIKRKTIIYENVATYFSEISFLKLFFYIKCNEAKSLGTQTNFNQKHNEIIALYKQTDIFYTLDLIFLNCKNLRNSQISNIKFNPLIA